MHYVDRPHKCSFTCTEKGIKVWCDRSEKPGCVCPFEKYYNVDSNECMEVKCENMDCADHENEAFFHCESGSRESCLCSSFVTLDCRTGCQCKNGYCRDNGKCVKRKCKGSPFAEVYGNWNVMNFEKAFKEDLNHRNWDRKSELSFYIKQKLKVSKVNYTIFDI